jgi:hypothetical protein
MGDYSANFVMLYSDPIWIVRKNSVGILSHKAPASHN